MFTSRRRGRKQRNIYLKQFDDIFWLLAENPEIDKDCDEIRDSYRKFPQGSHVIFYRQIGSQNIEIIRILHKSMDVNPIFAHSLHLKGESSKLKSDFWYLT